MSVNETLWNTFENQLNCVGDSLQFWEIQYLLDKISLAFHREKQHPYSQETVDSFQYFRGIIDRVPFCVNISQFLEEILFDHPDALKMMGQAKTRIVGGVLRCLIIVLRKQLWTLEQHLEKEQWNMHSLFRCWIDRVCWKRARCSFTEHMISTARLHHQVCLE